MNATHAAIPCHEHTFPEGVPAEYLSTEFCHDHSAEQALKAFERNLGTDKMVPTLIIAVYDAQRKIRFFPMNWRNEAQKTATIYAMRALFCAPDLRPDRYTFHGEVWIAAEAPDKNDPRMPSERPDSLDGLTVLSVDGSTGATFFSSYVRTDNGEGQATITKHSDSREGTHTAFEGRLADLLKPIDGETTTALILDIPM